MAEAGLCWRAVWPEEDAAAAADDDDDDGFSGELFPEMRCVVFRIERADAQPQRAITAR